MIFSVGIMYVTYFFLHLGHVFMISLEDRYGTVLGRAFLVGCTMGGLVGQERENVTTEGNTFSIYFERERNSRYRPLGRTKDRTL